MTSCSACQPRFKSTMKSQVEEKILLQLKVMNDCCNTFNNKRSFKSIQFNAMLKLVKKLKVLSIHLIQVSCT